MIEHLTDPETCEGDALEVHVEKCEHMLWLATSDKERAMSASIVAGRWCERAQKVQDRAIESLRRARLHKDGVECPDCSGSGEVEHKTWRFLTCTTCNGDGAVMPEATE